MPWLPALYRPKRRWRLPEQMDPLEYLDEHPNRENIWRSNYASLEEKVPEVLHDQASRGRIIVIVRTGSHEAIPFTGHRVGSANRKDKSDGQITARVLFDGTHGLV